MSGSPKKTQSPRVVTNKEILAAKKACEQAGQANLQAQMTLGYRIQQLKNYNEIVAKSKKSSTHISSDEGYGTRFAGSRNAYVDDKLLASNLKKTAFEKGFLKEYSEAHPSETSSYLNTMILPAHLQEEIRKAKQTSTFCSDTLKLQTNNLIKLRITQLKSAIKPCSNFLYELKNACEDYLEETGKKWFFTDLRNGEGKKAIVKLLPIIEVLIKTEEISRHDVDSLSSHGISLNLQTIELKLANVEPLLEDLKSLITASEIMTLEKGDRGFYFNTVKKDPNLKKLMGPSAQAPTTITLFAPGSIPSVHDKKPGISSGPHSGS